MAEINRSNDISSSSPEWEEGTEEVLLADLTGNEGADIFFEGLVDRDTGMGRTLEKIKHSGLSGTDVTGGDIDDDWYQAEVVGEEAVGGQNPTPDQNVTDGLLDSMGLSVQNVERVHTRDVLERRDNSRWELDPSSSEDYQER
jgi:hypothetical protein